LVSVMMRVYDGIHWLVLWCVCYDACVWWHTLVSVMMRVYDGIHWLVLWCMCMMACIA